MWSPNAPSMSTHQMALSNLKERCSSQQKKLDDFEREKLVLLYENEDLKVNLRQLDEDNLELRERNLEVNHQLKQSQYEILELRRHLDRVGRSNSQEVAAVASMLSSAEVIDNHYSDTEELTREVHKVNESMSLLKKSLLEQQLFVKRLIEETRLTESGAKDEVFLEASSSIGAVATAAENVTPTNSLRLEESAMAVSYDPTRPQVCPMCEATFPAVDFTQEGFLDHVNSHFTCEDEADTLQNYEVVNADASMLPSS